MTKETWSAKLKREKQEAIDKLNALKVKFDDNVFTAEEVKTLKVYRTGFWILSGVIVVLLLSLLF